MLNCMGLHRGQRKDNTFLRNVLARSNVFDTLSSDVSAFPCITRGFLFIFLYKLKIYVLENLTKDQPEFKKTVFTEHIKIAVCYISFFCYIYHKKKPLKCLKIIILSKSKSAYCSSSSRISIWYLLFCVFLAAVSYATSVICYHID